MGLFVTQGISETTIRAIAQGAGVAEGMARVDDVARTPAADDDSRDFEERPTF